MYCKKRSKYVGQNYEDLPEDTIREYLLKLPVEDIVRNRRTSKEFKDIIDRNEFWCNLIERDYEGEEYDKINCLNEYKRKHKANYLTITDRQLENCNNSDTYTFTRTILGRSGFERDEKNKLWYFDPKNYFFSDYTMYHNLFKDIQNRKPKKYVQLDDKLYMNKDEIADYDCLSKLTKNKIYYELKPEGKGFYYVEKRMNNKDFIELYKNAYGDKSFNEDFIKGISEHLGGVSKHNETPEQLLVKFYKTLN